MFRRPRRNRKSPAVRALVREVELRPNDLIAPLFVLDGVDRCEPINSMPGVNRFSINRLLLEIAALRQAGIEAVNLFPYIPAADKNAFGSKALEADNLVCRAINAVKERFPSLCVIVDVALDPYTDHGHDGLVDQSGRIVNDQTVEILCQMSLLAAKAGADIIAPSDMMDGRVRAIRSALDGEGYQEVSILSYAAKYASAFYTPFREALDSAPKIGNKLTYQLDPANSREALLECYLDESEGADLLLIKPALAYLDIIAKVRQQTNLPLGGYHVSGEYAMVMAAGRLGWLDAEAALMESLISIKRAGADFIFTYAAGRIAESLS